MNTPPIVTRDERTMAVENQSIIWAYCFITYALLLDVMYRSLVLNEAAWDLLGMVIVGGFISTSYQYFQKTITKGWLSRTTIVMLLGMGVAAFVVAFILAWN